MNRGAGRYRNIHSGPDSFDPTISHQNRRVIYLDEWGSEDGGMLDGVPSNIGRAHAVDRWRLRSRATVRSDCDEERKKINFLTDHLSSV